MCICGSDVVPCLLHDGGSRLSLSKALMQEYDRTEAKDFLCSQSLCFLEKIELTGLFVTEKIPMYYSITAGSRQGNLAKSLSLLFLTPRPGFDFKGEMHKKAH